MRERGNKALLKTVVLDGSDWSVSSSGHLTLRERVPSTYWEGGCTASMAGTDMETQWQTEPPAHVGNQIQSSCLYPVTLMNYPVLLVDVSITCYHTNHLQNKIFHVIAML
jgi:hypothetical protein